MGKQMRCVRLANNHFVAISSSVVSLHENRKEQTVKPDPGERSCNIMDEEKNEREHDATELERRRGAQIHHHPPTAALSLVNFDLCSL